MESFVPGRPSATVRPSGWWYVATIGIAGCGVLVAVALLVGGLHATQQAGRDLTVVELGHSGPVTFIEGGSYTLFYEGPHRASSQVEVRRLAAELNPVLRPAAGGSAVAMKPYEGTSTIVNAAGKNVQLVPVLTFEITAPGEYVLAADRLEGVADHYGRVSVGKSLLKPLVHGALWALVAVVVAVFLSIVATVALAVTRGRAKRRAGAAGGPGPGPFGGPRWPAPVQSRPVAGPGSWPGGGPVPGPWPAPAPPPPPPGY